jgi:ferredoxin
MSTTTTNKSEQDAATEDFLDRPEYAQVTRDVRPSVPRYRNEIGKYRVHRSSACKQCGRCAEVCGYGVHTRPTGYRLIIRPFDYRCIGTDCEKSDTCCIQACPQNALSLTTNPAFETLGDFRWTPDLITSTWLMAETGHPPGPDRECEIGASGGGFDRIRLKFPVSPPAGLRREDINTEIHASG